MRIISAMPAAEFEEGESEDGMKSNADLVFANSLFLKILPSQ